MILLIGTSEMLSVGEDVYSQPLQIGGTAKHVQWKLGWESSVANAIFVSATVHIH